MSSSQVVDTFANPPRFFLTGANIGFNTVLADLFISEALPLRAFLLIGEGVRVLAMMDIRCCKHINRFLEDIPKEKRLIALRALAVRFFLSKTSLPPSLTRHQMGAVTFFTYSTSSRI
jgi:hypothetical protein